MGSETLIFGKINNKNQPEFEAEEEEEAPLGCQVVLPW